MNSALPLRDHGFLCPLPAYAIKQDVMPHANAQADVGARRSHPSLEPSAHPTLHAAWPSWAGAALGAGQRWSGADSGRQLPTCSVRHCHAASALTLSAALTFGSAKPAMFGIELPPYALEAAVAAAVVLGVLVFLTSKVSLGEGILRTPSKPRPPAPACHVFRPAPPPVGDALQCSYWEVACQVAWECRAARRSREDRVEQPLTPLA